MVHDMRLHRDATRCCSTCRCTFDLDAAMAGARLPYRWNAEYGARIGLLPLDGPRRAGASVRWFEIEPLLRLPPAQRLRPAPTGSVVARRGAPPEDVRHATASGPNEGAAAPRPVDDRPGRRARSPRRRSTTAPRSSPASTSASRAGATATATASTVQAAPIARTGPRSSTTWWPAPPRSTTTARAASTLEPVFVPREGATAEDDGWVLAYVYDATTDRSDVVVLDAQDFTGEPVATVHLPVRVPFGFHGNWVPTAR